MSMERHERARFAAELRRRGTMLSDEAVADVCEAYLELVDEGTITLELHRRLLDEAKNRRCSSWYVVACEQGDELFLRNGEPVFNVVRGHSAPYEHYDQGCFSINEAKRIARALNEGRQP